ncbi:MAG: pyocin activator PrtN family protein [Plesiomonas sp.]|uniref:pyocin activator PrtN family protein n=1 Tax=Plesiomonas sp. TaxID=2486279 RepID=UPI003F40FBCB
MKTVFLLLAEFESPIIPLSAISEKYLGLKPATAETKARASELPFPTFRAGEGQKAPRVVHIEDFAIFLDARRKSAQEEFNYQQ